MRLKFLFIFLAIQVTGLSLAQNIHHKTLHSSVGGKSNSGHGSSGGGQPSDYRGHGFGHGSHMSDKRGQGTGYSKHVTKHVGHVSSDRIYGSSHGSHLGSSGRFRSHKGHGPHSSGSGLFVTPSGHKSSSVSIRERSGIRVSSPHERHGSNYGNSGSAHISHSAELGGVGLISSSGHVSSSGSRRFQVPQEQRSHRELVSPHDHRLLRGKDVSQNGLGRSSLLHKKDQVSSPGSHRIPLGHHGHHGSHYGHGHSRHEPLSVGLDTFTLPSPRSYSSSSHHGSDGHPSHHGSYSNNGLRHKRNSHHGSHSFRQNGSGTLRRSRLEHPGYGTNHRSHHNRHDSFVLRPEKRIHNSFHHEFQFNHHGFGLSSPHGHHVSQNGFHKGQKSNHGYQESHHSLFPGSHRSHHRLHHNLHGSSDRHNSFGLNSHIGSPYRYPGSHHSLQHRPHGFRHGLQDGSQNRYGSTHGSNPYRVRHGTRHGLLISSPYRRTSGNGSHHESQLGNHKEFHHESRRGSLDLVGATYSTFKTILNDIDDADIKRELEDMWNDISKYPEKSSSSSDNYEDDDDDDDDDEDDEDE
ncbi:hypothetical protein C0J52_18937 [Blattella germanica]|nr:hypothetical protein C0J52_18937 [Blattella germanica]